jgi:hypothetical protein
MLIALAACSGGGGGGVSGGAATVRGVVVTFDDGTTAFYSPRDVQDVAALPRWFSSLRIINTACAGVGGVTVGVQGTDLVGTTDSEGFFIISGVPPGDQVLVFSRNGASSTLGLAVPANSSIDLGDVRISGGSATPGDVRVEIFEDDADSNSNSGPGSGDDATEVEDRSGSNSGSDDVDDDSEDDISSSNSGPGGGEDDDDDDRSGSNSGPG